MKKEHILIVEDERLVATDIKVCLKRLGYEVAGVTYSGEAAIKKAEELKPDLVLMDIVLEGKINGIDAAAKIRSRFNIPVVYLTAYSDLITIERAKKAEPYGYILKPFEDRDLHSTIEMALYKHTMENMLRESEAFNFALFQYNPIETIAVDHEGKVKKINMAKRKSGDRLPNLGDVMYKDYAGKHEIDMHAELTACINKGKKKDFPELKYGEKFLSITIAPFSEGAIITSQDITERKRAEEALQDSKERYHAIFGQAADSLVLVDGETGELVEFNDKAHENLGYSREEFKKLKIPDFEIIESTGEVVKHIDRIIKEGADTFETKHKTKDGDIRDILVSSRAISIREKNFIQSIWRDITEHKRAQEALRIERDNLTRILESMEDGVYIVNQQYDFEYVNPILIKEFGQPGKKKCYTYFHDRKKVCPWCKNKDVFAGKIVRWEWYSFKNQKTYDLIDTPIKNPDGSISKLEIFRDITHQKRAEKALREREAQYRNLIEGSPDIIWSFSDKKGTLYASSRVESFLGYSPDYLYKNPWLWTKSIHPDDQDHIVNAIKDFATGKEIDVEYRIRNSRGNWRWFHDRSIGRKVKDKETIIDGISSDITERKKTEEELKQSQVQLRDLTAHLQSIREQERTVIAREMHDELGQSLTALKMDLSWLDRKTPKDQKPLVDRIISMRELIDSTLQTVKRISAELRPELLDDLGLSAAIEWQGEEFQNRTGIKSEVTMDPEEIILDRERSTAIFRIFQETLTNVARHSHATRVTVKLKVKTGKIELKVKDNGKGITEKQISGPKSFGLIGIRERVHFLEGDVTIRGAQDKGTTVTVRIPIPKEGKAG
jgi:PAS domain S-box-containing protein